MVMKPNRTIQQVRLSTTFLQMWGLLVLITLFINSSGAIRVYDGTNIPSPATKSHKTSGLSKKSLYISKRSWSPVEEKLLAKPERRLEEKRKEINKRLGVEETPSLYKIKFADKNLMQYLRYIKEIPRLEEYTFCLWYKSDNLTHDQTLFSYSLNKNEVLLRFWISGLDSVLKMAIRENPVYKVPANLREHKWHHICQSWNGVLGQWQVFLDGKRIGAGLLSHYKGTYIPEGGEVTLGQELIGLKKRLNDGMEGEIFGFNLVDEAVPQDQAIFINAQYKPNIQSAVPPFKKLPPIKKTYQEIKAYISSLPSDPADGLKNDEELLEVPNVIKKPKETYSRPPKRNRGSHRYRYPPMRKVVVYNREDRQLPLVEAVIELNRTRPAAKNQTVVPKNENYSIHSYRLGNEERKSKNYEIYEIVDDDFDNTAPEDEQTNEQSLERKARQNFNLFTAREANKVYTLSNSVKNLKKPKFHFEMNNEENNNRRSFDVKKEIAQKESSEKKSPGSDIIPVYEIEINTKRKKRSAEGAREPRQFTLDDPLTDSNGFRRLPQIPESFINIFSKNSSKSEIEKTLEEFFPQSNATNEMIGTAETTEIPKATLEETVVLSFPPATDTQTKRISSEEEKQTPVPAVTVAPAIQQIPIVGGLSEMNPTMFVSGLTNQGPVNFPMVQEFNPRRAQEETSSSFRYKNPGQVKESVMEKRRFDVSSGTDLVMRSYGECTVDRGSPIHDKERLVISWADTPVRIFGGAQTLMTPPLSQNLNGRRAFRYSF